MKLSITMISYEDLAKQGKMTVAEFIETCAGLGVDAVDILEYFWYDKEKEVKEIPSLLKAKGLEIGAFCVGNNFIVPKEDRVKQIEYVKEGIRTAVKLGADKLRIFGGSRDIPEGINKDERLDIIIDCIGQIIGYTKENGVRLVIENHGGIPVTSSQMLTLLNAIDSPWLKVNFDIGNFLSAGGQDPIEAAKELYTHVDFIHAKDLIKLDNGSFQSCITGQGIIPVKETIEFFHEKGYNGYISLEYEAWKTTESTKGVKPSIDYLKSIIKELG